jgi:hypothetical protein
LKEQEMNRRKLLRWRGQRQQRQKFRPQQKGLL